METSRRIFSYDEALATFPLVRERTANAVREVEALASRLGDGLEDDDESVDSESRFHEIVGRWAKDVESVGCEVKGLWLVDWDSGDGYYCWKYPEPALGHFHLYDDGFSGRMPIT